DPIGDLSDLAEERGLHLHVDAAFGGFVLPFLSGPVPPFDFQLPGVSSITVDPHKMGLSVQPAGGLLFRDAALAVPVQVDVPYLAGGATSHATITGTRTGAAVLATWALMRHLGRSGYREVVERCMDLTADLVAAVEQVEGVEVVMSPTMNIVGIRPTEGGVEGLSASLRSSGWAIGQFATHVRVVLLPHVKGGHLERFVADLKAGVAVAVS
ncbi:MAG: pyridoxal-dependent decarboxylase, partial [Planctomycetota bacterium]|nr:pyridoxal-dependent decarboxylase [Planctomycetota bacterium]